MEKKDFDETYELFKECIESSFLSDFTNIDFFSANEQLAFLIEEEINRSKDGDRENDQLKLLKILLGYTGHLSHVLNGCMILKNIDGYEKFNTNGFVA